MSLVLVTGATGFLGSHIVDALQSRGHNVRALVRVTSETQSLKAREVELVVGDVMSGVGIPQAIDGVDVVIHAAGGGKVKRMSDMDAQNTASTAHLLGALNDAKSDARFVLTSSMAAMGPANDRIAVAPNDVARPVSAYGRSKLAAERLLLNEKERRHVTIVRPPGVYGPGDTRFLSLFAAVQKGIAPIPPGRTTSVIYGPDCADALVRASFEEYASRIESGTAFHVEDGEVHTWRSLANHIAVALEKRPLVFKIPSGALFVAGATSEVVGRLRNRAVVLTRDKWRDGKQKDWVTTSRSTREQLDWSPTLTFSQGAKVTADWYRAEGWL